MVYDDSTMPRNVSCVTVVTSMDNTQLNGTTLERLVADEKHASFEFVTCFIVEDSSPVRYNTVLFSYRSFVGLSCLHLQGCSPRRRRHGPENGDSEVPETSVINRPGVICQNTYLSTALWELLVSPCCVCCFGYRRSRPKTTICHLVRLEWCVVAVGFGNGSPGAEYGSFLCSVLGGINTKTMQLGGGQVMRGHGREMALLPNAAKICVLRDAKCGSCSSLRVWYGSLSSQGFLKLPNAKAKFSVSPPCRHTGANVMLLLNTLITTLR